MNNTRKSVNLLPSYFQTEKNSKFLSSTLDPLYQVPELRRINGYVGSKLTSTYDPQRDVYIPFGNDGNNLRNKYSLHPALTLRNNQEQITKSFGFDDLINQLSIYEANVNNIDSLVQPKFASYDPHIDWDKFINFQEYFWLPVGPDTITISGIQQETVSTYNVTDSADQKFFIFTPDGITTNPLLTFYKGVTYIFNVNTQNKFFIKFVNQNGSDNILTENNGIINNGISNGQIIFTVPDNAPEELYYASDSESYVVGKILIRRIQENSELDVEAEIIGKSQYRSSPTPNSPNGIEFINGLKVRFVGNVTPEYYSNREFIVEGVGKSIQLIDYASLTTPDQIASLVDDDFDVSPFDEFPFDGFDTLPLVPEYVTINRASKDQNPWSRYNRWFHREVIETTARENGVELFLDLKGKGRRPIIEFKPNIQLFNFGRDSVGTVDLIDFETADAFSEVEGARSYIVDGVQLEAGQRIIFNSDLDQMVRGKVFQVEFATIGDNEVINLVEVITPYFGNSTVISQGTKWKGKEWWFNGIEWVLSQQRTRINQFPLFDLFDKDGNSFSDRTVYNSIFNGNSLFGYVVGTGTVDPVLGFPLSYKNIGLEGSYIFENYFETQTITVLGQDSVTEIPTSTTYLKYNDVQPYYDNVWMPAEPLKLPVQQFQVINDQDLIEITVFDRPAYINDLKIEVFVNNTKLVENQNFQLVTDKEKLFVKLLNLIDTKNLKVLFNCYSEIAANDTGTYQLPINLTNNPLNTSLTNFTLSELSDHVRSMVERDPTFVGSYPGKSNLGQLPDITKYGSRLISNYNPLSFSSMFITNVENSLINAIRQTADDYYQFKLSLMKFALTGNINDSPVDILDYAILETSRNKNKSFPYSQSDMLGHGSNVEIRNYTVTDSRNIRYALPEQYDLTQLSFRSVLVYRNQTQLLHGRDYEFDNFSAAVEINVPLTRGDQISIRYYNNTSGSYVPPTPTKLGMFPSYYPEIIIDRTYATDPQVIIQGHDGSLTVGYTHVNQAEVGNYDYRDLVLLEFEKRVFNNLKTNYNSDLINIDKILPSVFRNSNVDYYQIFDLVQKDFIKWASVYGIDYITNNTYDATNYKTYNYRSSSDQIFNSTVPGYWRGIYKYYFDTDRPNTHPWEMLGFSLKPLWWENEYGPAPYTSGNTILWQDLEQGLIRQGERAGIDDNYARPGLSQIIPVDDSGNIIDIRNWGSIDLNNWIDNTDQNWKFGDHAPAETAWRRSSLWPYAVQIILALTKPADYASMMFDPGRLKKDITGQYRYGPNNEFLNLKNVYLNGDIDQQGNVVQTSGYSVMVIDNGIRRTAGYPTHLKQMLSNCGFNLFYKAGGFLSKDKLDIIIDSVSPDTVSAGALLPNEDYELLLNVSNPIRTVSASGIIVEKKNGKFMVRGYDRQYPYFRIRQPLHKNNDSSVTVGGKSPVVLTWTPNTFYQAGQYIKNNNIFYNVPNSLNSGTFFNEADYIRLAQLPIIGGATALIVQEYDTNYTLIPYGTQYSTIQEVYDLIVGYGKYLTDQGFEFNSYDSDLQQVLDWSFTGKEFLFWTTQNWSTGSVITLSPFAEQIQFRANDAVVDNVFNGFYDYSIYNASGIVFPQQNIDVSREDGLCTLRSVNTNDGFYYVRLNLIQKEHAIVMNNSSLFGDIIYDVETGYRQQRIKLAGFITDNWNGDYLSPGFVYDEAIINDWQSFRDYQVADVVKYSGKYYSANENISGSSQFNFNQWSLLGTAPVAQLLPNFDYKINQFEDFYSLDIDNFDIAQQQLAQRLTGYIPRPYLSNIIADPIAQYKFYQGFIKEKGTANAINKLSKASLNNLNGIIEFNEEWAIRLGFYGNYESFNEIEFPLKEQDFNENNQIIEFVDEVPTVKNNVFSYITPLEITIKDQEYQSQSVFSTTTSSTYLKNNFIYPVAGYVRADDVTATAYSVSSLFDIADINAVQDGDTIWVGFEPANEWNVYRYTQQSAKVINSSIEISGSQMIVETDILHNLSVGDIIAFGTLDNDTNGVYQILSIPSLTTFIVSTEFTSIAESNTQSLLYKFVSVRINEFDDILNYENEFNITNGDRFWADSGIKNDANSSWAVFEKTFNFNTSTELLSGINVSNQNYGWQISTVDGADRLVVSAPNYVSSGLYGRISVFSIIGREAQLLTTFGVNGDLPLSVPTELGYSLLYDREFDIIVSGAPLIDSIQINQIDRQTGQNLQLISKTENLDGRYGSEVYLSKQSIENRKFLLVAAPNEGLVYHYILEKDQSSTATNLLTIPVQTIPISTSTSDYSISGNLDGTIVAISNPTQAATTGTGQVNIYNVISGGYVLIQTLLTPDVDNFGKSIALSDDGQYLAVSSDKAITPMKPVGKVYIYKWNSQTQRYDSTPYQTLLNPTLDTGMSFGTKVKFDSSAEILLVSASGTQDTPVEFIDNTIFDNKSTNFVELVENSGTVYSFERKNLKFIFSCEVFDESSLSIVSGTIDQRGSNYGNSLAINNRDVFIGAPTVSSETLTAIGTVHQFNRIDNSQGCWKILRSQAETVDIDKIKNSFTVNINEQQVIEYLDIIDPIKGKISGLAEQELKYKTAFDPAVYSVGNDSVVVNNESSWIEEHVGELWWDLSTLKYIWYEQGDHEFRKNSWGQLFPGASIDVYEWVRSEYLPSQWSALADTTEGLTQGISGQPKYPDNSVVSVKQSVNPATGQTTNLYFYWVKNKTTIPAQTARRYSASEVASIIFDPSSYGMRYISVVSPNSIVVTNIRDTLVNQNIHLNISKDKIDTNINRHTDWILIGEGDEAGMPSEMLNKKLIDSLVGKDSLGNLVPDPTLSNRIKYGIQIRPRQSMFVNRTGALRNAIEYANNVMSQFLISDIADFGLLNTKQEIPDEFSRDYDIIVTTYEDLVAINTSNFVTASLECTIDSSLGIINSVNIVNPGSGYGTLLPTELDNDGNPIRWAGPKISISNNLSDVEIESEVDNNGSIILTKIIKVGSGLVSPPILSVRPYTAIVEVDDNSNGRWAKYQLQGNTWVKIFTQDFNTTQYWDYVDWVEPSYDSLKPLNFTVNELYQLSQIQIEVGDYVKVKNQGNGRYVILKRIDGEGTFSFNYDLMLSEKGTIRFKELLWNTVNNQFNFDNIFTFDQTLYDQTPEKELINILNALKNEIFVGSLKVYWNLFFFKCLKYAFSEQKFLDWAFKTSLINVKNLAGPLTQRAVYKFQNSQYYEEYINEVKPYHTNIRNYQVNYSVDEPSNTFVSDFDLPAVYDVDQNQYIDVLNNQELLQEYPWKSWQDNYKFFVDSIVVGFSGSGYTAPPVVEIVPAPNDTGSGATAEARISLGKIVSIQVTNPGSGYIKTPTVVITGGGSTELIPAKAYPIMSNGKVRSVLTSIKLDRNSTEPLLTSSTHTDTFVSDGERIRYTLSWAATSDKNNIEITAAGQKVLSADYSVESYRVLTNGYHKIFTDIILNEAVLAGQLISITYSKNINLYNAIDRIEDYYDPGIGMPGKNLSQLITGIEYPGSHIEGLPFEHSSSWDTMPFGQASFGDQLTSYISSVVSETTSTGTTVLKLDTVENLSIGLRATSVVIDPLTINENKFLSDNVTIIDINTLTNEVTFSTSTVDVINSGTVKIEFWNFNLLPSVVDTAIDGGDLSYNTAQGILPEDINIDGETFISPNIGHSPEELIKGELHESLSVSVFTGASQGAPLITQTYYEIDQTTSTTSIELMQLPANTASTMLIFDHKLLSFGIDYSYDYSSKTITVNTQTNTGILQITVVGVGGNQYLYNDYQTVSNTTTVSAQISNHVSNLGIYATLNGQELNSSQYTIINGFLTVNGISTSSNTLQVWSFSGNGTPYSVVREQVFITDGSASEFSLQFLPGDVGSPNAQSIVDVDGHILIPPTTVYYLFDGSGHIFDIDPYNTRPTGAYDLSLIEVYVNGVRMQYGVHFVLNQPLSQIEFLSNVLQPGDAIAITNTLSSDYYFNYDIKKLVVRQTANITSQSRIKVISFNNSEGSALQTEVFDARSSRRYPLSRPTLNDQYLWVMVNKKPLINGIDYYLSNDSRTLILRDSYPYNQNDRIVIISMSNIIANEMLGYRMFTDMLGRTTYRRISQRNSSKLLHTLYSTSTEIVLDSANGLHSPNPATKVPGVLFVSGERIEYNSISGNTLTGIKRSTLGTGARDLYPAGTTVYDQSFVQSMPYNEQLLTQTLISTTASSYTINGISLTTSTAKDQLLIYYGGTQLNKSIFYRQNTEISYDQTPHKIIGEVSTTTSLPSTVVIGTAYVVTSTNQVWIYTNSKLNNSINGYVYTGLDRVNPQYEITDVSTSGTTSTATLNLNLENIVSGTNILIVQRIALNNFYYDTQTSLLNDPGINSRFLNDGPTVLPDKYYYGTG